MATRKDNTPQGDVFELRDDGTVRLAWDTYDVTLRRPKIGEWASYLEEAELADVWRTRDEDDKPRLRKYSELLSDEGPYLGLHARIISELGGEEIKRTDLATWMVDGKLIGDLTAHWGSAPLAGTGRPETASP